MPTHTRSRWGSAVIEHMRDGVYGQWSPLRIYPLNANIYLGDAGVNFLYIFFSKVVMLDGINLFFKW